MTPTRAAATHPDLGRGPGHPARGDASLQVEVFSNLVYVRSALWGLFSLPGVSLATSYYSDTSGQHDAITGRRGSYAQTRANIARAIKRKISVRVGVVDLGGEQRWRQAVAELEALGVTAIGRDRVRQVGRGVRDAKPDMDQLCGNCANGVAAISPMGEVWPCVFSRWMPSGNVLKSSLAEILDGGLRESRQRLMACFEGRDQAEEGNQRCSPNCEPIDCGPRCGPMVPSCGPEECSPARQFCSPNYPGPDRRCQPREQPCRPMQCNPTRP
jgi:Iron-sulfur cluster-binding domain